ncbi:MAG: HAD hydrolase family protein [Bacteroidota bacterium]
MNNLEVFKDISTFIFDVDGVMTNSQLLVTEEGQLLRSMNTRDGFALKVAARAGYRVVIITGGTSQGVVKRLQGLGITEIYAGIERKIDTYEQYIKDNKLRNSEILYMGDDLPDYEVMLKVGLPACPADAAPEIKRISNYVSPVDGGKGCVHDVIERVLKLHDKWQ